MRVEVRVRAHARPRASTRTSTPQRGRLADGPSGQEPCSVVYSRGAVPDSAGRWLVYLGGLVLIQAAFVWAEGRTREPRPLRERVRSSVVITALVVGCMWGLVRLGWW